MFLYLELSSVLSYSHSMYCRSDVLVHVEQIRWIELILQSHKSFIVWTIRISDTIFALLLTEVVDVDSSFDKRLHRLPKSTRPVYIFLRLSGLCPDRKYLHVVLLVAVGKRSFCLAHTT